MEPNKKIGILTQPLEHNYGGLLQAYALCEVLKKEGFEPIVLDRKYNLSTFRKFLLLSKNLLRKLILGSHKLQLSKADKSYIYQSTDDFIQKYIPNLGFKTTSKLREYDKNNLVHAYIVGSDQVWRPMYSPNLSTYFLDFCAENKLVKKISYAASFGVSDWEYTLYQSDIARKLIKLFNAVSVREDSGVDLCKNKLDCLAVHVLDPTLLLGKDTYIELFKGENEIKTEGSLFTYILDANSEKEQVINQYEKVLHLKAFSSQPKTTKFTKKLIENDIESFKYPSVTKWIRSFYDAEFVVTDSFHGCVFSIIFNKPFIAIINEGRGASRFHSLLSSLDLENRIYHQGFKNEDINWNSVNTKLKNLKEMSMSFLKNNLNE